jgi:hypothetical protein
VHRLENALNAATTKTNHVTAIYRLLKGWNETESFGIPVGNQPSRLLAEAVLMDVDEALLADGIDFIRYTDDYRIFAKNHAEAYHHLAFLADTLYKNHGLTLQPQKTRVFPRSSFKNWLFASPEHRELNSLKSKFQELTSELGLSDPYRSINYSELSGEQQAMVDSLNLQGLFREQIETLPDFALVGFILRRMAQLGDPSLADAVIDNLDQLYPVFADIINYLKSLDILGAKDYQRIGGKVLDALKGSIVSELEYHRLWGLDLFASSTRWNHSHRFFQMLQHLTRSVDAS